MHVMRMIYIFIWWWWWWWWWWWHDDDDWQSSYFQTCTHECHWQLLSKLPPYFSTSVVEQIPPEQDQNNLPVWHFFKFFASTSDVMSFNVEKTLAYLCVCFCVQIFPATRARKVQRIPLLGEIAVYCLTVYLCKKGPTEIADYLLFLYL